MRISRHISTTAALLELSERPVPSETLTGQNMVRFYDATERHRAPIIRGAFDNVLEISRSALFGAPESFPVGGLCHLFDDEFFSEYSLDDSDTVFANDAEFARLCAFLSIGELFTYLNEEKPAAPTPITSTYSRTYAYALGRSILLWGPKRSKGIYERWALLRQKLRWTPAKILPPSDVERVVSPWLDDFKLMPWAREVLAIKHARPKSLIGEVSILVSEELGLALQPPPLSFDSRFEWLGLAATRLRAVEPKQSGRSSLALALLVAAAEPGELMHLNWLRPHIKHFPHAAIHYAGWSALLRDAGDREVEPLGGLPRLIARELQRPLDLTQPPLADASLFDLLAAGKPLDESQLKASPRIFSVSLVPGVVISSHFASTDNRRPDPVPSHLAEREERDVPAAPQRQLFETAEDQSFRRMVIGQLEVIHRQIADLQSAKKRPARK